MKVRISEWYRNKKYQQEIDEEVLNGENPREIIRERAIQGIIQDGDYSGHEPEKYVLRDRYGNVLHKFDEIKSEIPYGILVKPILQDD